jgi:transglutaminase-like putative cysteine protease
VGLGPAEGIRVTRRTNLHESTSGLRNNTTVLDHRVHVELANQLARPVTVEVRERVPETSEPDVRIEERADWTAPEEDTGPDRHAPGTRVWRLDLPAGATAALDGGYEIRIPTGKALVGGNRRS